MVAADTRKAFELGQVDELLVSATLDRAASQEDEAVNAGSARTVAAGRTGSGTKEASTAVDVSAAERVAEELVTKAAQTGARVTFIEDASLLAHVDGVGAFLRFSL